MKEHTQDEETLDIITGGRIKVLQKVKGYRFSIDALLLSHFVRLRQGERVLEMGSGSGVISIILARRWEDVEITGIDIQAGMVEMAGRSVAINGLSEKVKFLRADIRDMKDIFPARSFDAVVSNPPYRKINSGKVNPHSEKALARHEIAGTIGDFLQAASYALKPAGRAYLIYPAARMVELLTAMRNARVEPKRLRLVHSKSKTVGKFTLVEGVREGGEELEVLPPLSIYEETGEYTEESNHIFNELSLPGSSAR